MLKEIATREKCPINFVGIVTGNGKIILSEEDDCDASKYLSKDYEDKRHPVDLDLELVLGKCLVDFQSSEAGSPIISC